MSIYTIKAIKRTPIAKKDGTGTWTKIQVKTQETNDDILEMGFGHPKNLKDNLKVGDKVSGYIESIPWYKTDGTKGGDNVRLQGITTDYLYRLILTMDPTIEGRMNILAKEAPQKEDDGF